MSDPSYDEAIVKEPCSRAPLNPRWTFKLSIIAIIVFAVGVWGYIDATIVYPNRGEKFAQWAKWQYLDQAKKADAEDFGIFLRESSVTKPEEELARLSDSEQNSRNTQDANNPASSRTLRASMQLAREQWLEALDVIGKLDPEHTTIESPQRTLDELAQTWSAAAAPKPLSGFDLLTQWLIMGICFLVTLLMVIHMLRVRSKRYAWEPDSMTITLPGGARVTPDDLEEVDKRKWDKFIVFLKIKDSHPDLGGQEVGVDTYQHKRVEDWILAMEAKAFPSEEEEDVSDEEEPNPQQNGKSDTNKNASGNNTSNVQRLKDLAVLGLDEDATDEDIHAAYRRISKVHHPDRYTHLNDEDDVKNANESFRLIQEAYERLKK